MLNSTFKAYEEQILNKLHITYSGLLLCELGNQRYRGKPAKLMYESLGVKHTSIDINGFDGAIPLDLDFAVPKTFETSFNVITNYGTTEHVNNQYSVFKNIHVMGKNNCVVLHGVPLVGNWPTHCRYYYSKDFFTGLINVCSYELIDLRIFTTGQYRRPRNLLACVLRKVKDIPFVSPKEFLGVGGVLDSKDRTNTGNYSIRKK